MNKPSTMHPLKRLKLKERLVFVLVFLIALSGLVLLKPDSTMLFNGDDDDYFAVASSIAFGKFPYFSNEYHVGEKMPFASVGPGVLAAPFVFSFSLIDRVQHKEIVMKRDKDNRYWSWSLFGFHFAAYLYFLISAIVLFEMLRLWSSSFSAFITTSSIIIGGGGFLIYVFKRPIMSHVFELFAISLSLLLVSLALRRKYIRNHAAWLGGCAAFVFLTRYNNAPLALGFVATLLYTLRKQNIEARRRQQILAIVFFAWPIALFRFLPVLANGYSTYDQAYGGAMDRLNVIMSPIFYLVRLKEIIFGLDMGLLYTAPISLVAFICLCFNWKRAPKEFLFLSAFAAINLYLAIVWRSFGSYYGYRYIVFTAMPLLSIYLAVAIDRFKERFGASSVLILFAILIPMPLLSMIVFGLNSRFSFDLVINSYGVAAYSQPEYHKNLISALTDSPLLLFHQFTESFLASLHSPSATPEHLLQRALLFSLPPSLVLLLYWLYGKRITKLRAASSVNG